MDHLHQTLLGLDEGLGPSGSPGLLAAWDWRSSSSSGPGPFELSQASPTHSLSPAPSVESYTPCGHGGAGQEGSGVEACGGRDAGGGLVEVDYDVLAFRPAYLQAAGPRAPKGSKVRMSVQRRRKASEREKLRMRTLADALHTLRTYLPPGYSPRGQPLTKIQTLKSTIKYIGELTDLLNGAGGREPRPQSA